MRTQAYHGGSKYTGVDLGILMENSTGIMNEIEVYLKSVSHQFKELLTMKSLSFVMW